MHVSVVSVVIHAVLQIVFCAQTADGILFPPKPAAAPAAPDAKAEGGESAESKDAKDAEPSDDKKVSHSM